HASAVFRRLLCKALDHSEICIFVRTGAELRQRGGHSRQPLHTSTQALSLENFSSSGMVSSMAELLEPQAGNTVSNRCRDSSRKTVTSAFTPNGHTPPTAWPISGSTSSKESIFALQPKRALYLGLSTLVSPAATIRMTPSFVRKDRVF